MKTLFTWLLWLIIVVSGVLVLLVLVPAAIMLVYALLSVRAHY